MRVVELTPTPTGRVLFHLRERNRVPNAAGCYVLTSAADDILYVGQSRFLHERFAQHYRDPTKTASTDYGVPARFWWRTCAPIELDGMERGWVGLFLVKEGRLPPLNEVYPPL